MVVDTVCSVFRPWGSFLNYVRTASQFCGRKLTDRLVEVHNDANGDTIKYVNAIESMLGKIIYSNV